MKEQVWYLVVLVNCLGDKYEQIMNAADVLGLAQYDDSGWNVILDNWWISY